MERRLTGRRSLLTAAVLRLLLRGGDTDSGDILKQRRKLKKGRTFTPGIRPPRGQTEFLYGRVCYTP